MQRYDRNCISRTLGVRAVGWRRIAGLQAGGHKSALPYRNCGAIAAVATARVGRSGSVAKSA
jgi:hypothetical protein